MRRVAEGLYQLDSCGKVNAYLIEGPVDLTLIDAGTQAGGPGLMAEIKENGFDIQRIGRVVITQASEDHAGGIGALLAQHRVRVFVHAADAPVLLGKSKPVRSNAADRLLGMFSRPQPLAPAETVVPLDAGAHLRGLPQWQVLHTPGHTPGSISLFNPAKQILICGDVLYVEGGELQRSRSPYLYDPKALSASIEALSKLDCDVLCPGHGPILRGGAFRHIESLAKRG